MIRIKNWETIYEDHRTRELKRPMEWIPFKISFSGYGYTYLMDEFKDKGAAYFGTFILLAELAGKSPRRGLLLRSNGTPYEPKGIARVLRLSVELVTETITACSSTECDWIETTENDPPRESRAIPRDPAPLRDKSRTENAVENQQVTEKPIVNRKKNPARSRANTAKKPRETAKNRATQHNSTEQNSIEHTHTARAHEDVAAPEQEGVCVKSLRDDERKKIEETLKPHFSEHQMKNLYQLVPGITMEYVSEKLKILKASTVERPTAFLWSALVDDYKPKSIANMRTKEKPVISEADFAALPDDVKEKYKPDEAISGETCYYLVSVHSH